MATQTLIDVDQFVVLHDGVLTHVISIPLPENSSAYIQFQGLAKRTNGDTKAWNRAFVCKRGTGDASIVGSLTNLIAPLGDLLATLAWDIQLDTDAENVLIQVKGQTSADIAWYLKVLGLTIQES